MIDLKTIRHEINNILFTVKTATEEIKNASPNMLLASENLKSALTKLEKLSAQIGLQSKEEAK